MCMSNHWVSKSSHPPRTSFSAGLLVPWQPIQRSMRKDKNLVSFIEKKIKTANLCHGVHKQQDSLQKCDWGGAWLINHFYFYICKFGILKGLSGVPSKYQVSIVQRCSLQWFFSVVVLTSTHIKIQNISRTPRFPHITLFIT